MQFLTLLVASASVVFAAAAAPPPATSSPATVAPGNQGLPHWCNGGVCSHERRDEFNTWRAVSPMPEGPVLCKNFGLTYCA
ncbi:hypothetical protein E4U17_000608 [Claviceps sp. LM77 group G4]|nr:hypothetical protein E4U17_000608 [Claviceps sp. LM77 group G4]KAG6078768.1 hypothetical protein E4U33_000585 [Claviceps sp. LM78 group G4]KAG6078833.1 hypothetical protein E4U16_001412 [Claviceps sp. LM84 group G4]